MYIKKSMALSRRFRQISKSISAFVLCVALVFVYSYKQPVQAHAAAGFWEAEYDVLVAQILNAMGVKVSGDVSDEQYNTIVGAIRQRAEDSLKAVNQQGIFQSIYNGWTSGWFTVGQNAYDAVANAWKNYQHDADLKSGFGINTSYSGTFSSCMELEKNFYMVGDDWGTNMDDNFIKTLSNWQAVACTTLTNGDITKNTSNSSYTVNKMLCGDLNANISLILYNQDAADKLYLNNADTFSKNLWFKGTSVSATNIKAFNCLYRNSDLAHYSVELNSQIKVLKAYCSSNQHDYLLFFDKEKPVNNVWSYWLYYYTDATANGINISANGQTFGQNELVDRSKILAEGESVVTGRDPAEIWEHIRERQLKGGVTTQDKNEIKIKSAAGVKNPADVRAQTQAQTTGLEKTAEAEAEDEAANAGNSTIPANVPDLTIPDAITKKFPFSLPWDLYNAVKTLQSPGQTPIIDFPVVLKSINYTQEIKIDLSQWNTLALIIRWALGLLFVVGLIIITPKVIKH